MKYLLVLFSLFFGKCCFCQSSRELIIDSLEKTIHYQYNNPVKISNVATINLDNIFKFIPEQDAVRIIETVLKNPRRNNITKGIIIPTNNRILEQKGIIFNIQLFENYKVIDENEIVVFDDFMTALNNENKVEYIDTKENKIYKLIYNKFLFNIYMIIRRKYMSFPKYLKS